MSFKKLDQAGILLGDRESLLKSGEVAMRVILGALNRMPLSGDQRCHADILRGLVVT